MRNGGWQFARRVNYNAFEMPVSKPCGVRYFLVLKKAPPVAQAKKWPNRSFYKKKFNTGFECSKTGKNMCWALSHPTLHPLAMTMNYNGFR
jgi:hypothetical protein